jgi:hypothetical protein
MATFQELQEIANKFNALPTKNPGAVAYVAPTSGDSHLKLLGHIHEEGIEKLISGECLLARFAKEVNYAELELRVFLVNKLKHYEFQNYLQIAGINPNFLQ